MNPLPNSLRYKTAVTRKRGQAKRLHPNSLLEHPVYTATQMIEKRELRPLPHRTLNVSRALARDIRPRLTPEMDTRFGRRKRKAEQSKRGRVGGALLPVIVILPGTFGKVPARKAGRRVQGCLWGSMILEVVSTPSEELKHFAAHFEPH